MLLSEKEIKVMCEKINISVTLFPEKSMTEDMLEICIKSTINL